MLEMWSANLFPKQMCTKPARDLFIHVFLMSLQLTESIYRSLPNVSRKMRFTVPYPLLAYPFYLVSDQNSLYILFIWKQLMNTNQRFVHSFIAPSYSLLSHCFLVFCVFSGREALANTVHISIPRVICFFPMRRERLLHRQFVGRQCWWSF